MKKLNIKVSAPLIPISILMVVLPCGFASAQEQAKEAAGQSAAAAVYDASGDFPKDNLFDPDAKDDDVIDELGSQEATNWDEMIMNSFGVPGELEGEYKPAQAEKTTDVLPPVDINTRLINESSLPLVAVFGNDNSEVASWPQGKTWLTGQLPVSRQFDLKGCKFNLKTGPVSVAHYLKSGNEYQIITDSMRPMTTMAPEPRSRDLYLSANADLYPEIEPSTLKACQTSIKGKIIAVGKFDLGPSVIGLKQTKMKHTISAVDKTTVKSVQVYLYWPVGREEPILVDDSGIYPVLSTAIFKISSAEKGLGLIEVVPHLGYQKGGKALTKAQLSELWGDR